MLPSLTARGDGACAVERDNAVLSAGLCVFLERCTERGLCDVRCPDRCLCAVRCPERGLSAVLSAVLSDALSADSVLIDDLCDVRCPDRLSVRCSI